MILDWRIDTLICYEIDGFRKRWYKIISNGVTVSMKARMSLIVLFGKALFKYIKIIINE